MLGWPQMAYLPYQLAGDCTRQLHVNVIGYTLLAQHLHMLHIGK